MLERNNLEMSANLEAALSENELKELCKTLWSWTLCAECERDRTCTSPSNSNCPSNRLPRLVHFSKYYAQQCRVYLDATDTLSERSVKTHRDLWDIINCLRRMPEVTKGRLIEVTKAASVGRSAGSGHGSADVTTDQGLAVDLAVRVFTMINCYTQPRGVSILEQGLHQAPWHQDVPLTKYIENLFPDDWSAPLKSESIGLSEEVRERITAAKLKKDLGLTFRPTNDIASHLRLDRQSNVLEIFQHTAVLKEHLRLTKDSPNDLPVAESLKR